MIREISRVKQVRGEARRRWFTDEYWDLYVWIDAGKSPIGFQLCYGKPDNEHALTWFDDKKPVHTRVSASKPGGRHSTMTPILVADGYFDDRTVRERFLRDSTEIDSSVREYVRDRLENFPGLG